MRALHCRGGLVRASASHARTARTAPARHAAHPRNARTFRFVNYGETLSGAEDAATTICCDGLVQGAALHLTHWNGNATPGRFYADTSAEICAEFVADEVAGGSDGLYAAATVVNNHYDTDGVLSVFTLLQPALAASAAPLLFAAAAAGDFEEWPAWPPADVAAPHADVADAPLKLDLALRALGAAAGGDAAAYAAALAALPALLAPGGLDTADVASLWRPGYDALTAAWRELAAPGGRIRAQRRAGRTCRVGLVAHDADVAEAPGPAISRAMGGPYDAPPRTLLAFAQPRGGSSGSGTGAAAELQLWHYRLELPRHCWARTVARPTHAAPDGDALRRALAARARADAATEAVAAALSAAAWVQEGLPGMTGVLRTKVPIADPPEVVIAALEAADVALRASAPSQQQQQRWQSGAAQAR